MELARDINFIQEDLEIMKKWVRKKFDEDNKEFEQLKEAIDKGLKSKVEDVEKAIKESNDFKTQIEHQINEIKDKVSVKSIEKLIENKLNSSIEKISKDLNEFFNKKIADQNILIQRLFKKIEDQSYALDKQNLSILKVEEKISDPDLISHYASQFTHITERKRVHKQKSLLAFMPHNEQSLSKSNEQNLNSYKKRNIKDQRKHEEEAELDQNFEVNSCPEARSQEMIGCSRLPVPRPKKTEFVAVSSESETEENEETQLKDEEEIHQKLPKLKKKSKDQAKTKVKKFKKI